MQNIREFFVTLVHKFLLAPDVSLHYGRREATTQGRIAYLCLGEERGGFFLKEGHSAEMG